MRRIFSLPAQLGILAVIVIVFGVMLWRSYSRNQAETIPAAMVPSGKPTSEAKANKTVVKEVQTAIAAQALARDGATQKAGAAVIDLVLPQTPKDAKDDEPVISEETRKNMIAQAAPLTLFPIQMPAPKQKPRVSENYAPYGRLIKCQLINAVDSANMETPLIAVVTEDVYNRDPSGISHRVIAAGDEVHGTASKGRERDRISSQGKFVIVRRNDNDDDNGFELSVAGIALDCDFDPNTGLYGLHDASAGIRGDVIETTEYAALKLFTATFIANASKGLQQTNSISNLLTGLVSTTPKPGIQTAAADGASAVATEYANHIKESIGKDGYFVAVPPGKRFYLYVHETLDFGKAARGTIVSNPINPDAPQSPNELLNKAEKLLKQ